MLFYVFVLFMCPLDPLHSGYVLTFGLCWVYPLNVTNIWTTFIPMISMFYHPLLFNGMSSTMCDKTCLAAYYCSQIAIRLFHMDNYFTPGRSMYKIPFIWSFTALRYSHIHRIPLIQLVLQGGAPTAIRQFKDQSNPAYIYRSNIDVHLSPIVCINM